MIVNEIGPAFPKSPEFNQGRRGKAIRDDLVTKLPAELCGGTDRCAGCPIAAITTHTQVVRNSLSCRSR